MEAAEQQDVSHLIARHIGPDDDVATLRRYLVDAGLLVRPSRGRYRRPLDRQ